jgi:hypothetical protein
MSLQRVDADTAETMAGVAWLLRRAAELVWFVVDIHGAGSSRHVLALGIDLAADEARNLLPDAISIAGPVPVGDEPAGLLRSAEQLLRSVAVPAAGAWAHGLTPGESPADCSHTRSATRVRMTLPATGPEQQSSPGQLAGTAEATTNRKEVDDHGALDCQV